MIPVPATVDCVSGGVSRVHGSLAYCKYTGKIASWSFEGFIDTDSTALPAGTTVEACMQACSRDDECACISRDENNGFCYRARSMACGSSDPSILNDNPSSAVYVRTRPAEWWALEPAQSWSLNEAAGTLVPNWNVTTSASSSYNTGEQTLWYTLWYEIDLCMMHRASKG